MARVFKIIASWILVLAGVYFALSGALDYYSARKAQTEAASAWADSVDESPVPAIAAAPEPANAHRNSSVARLTIPRLRADLFVGEGTGQRELKRGPGHMRGTSLPGGDGNCVIAGHRDTHFRVLQNIRKGDEIVLERDNNLFRYRVTQLSVISPSNTKCLNPTREPVLNLITCYPFHYVGSAPKRFVVHADLEKSSDTPRPGA